MTITTHQHSIRFPWNPLSSLFSTHHVQSFLSSLLLLLIFLIFLSPSLVLLSAGRSYIASDRVPVLVNNVGPFHNPAESYKYYSLPYCEPKAPAVNPDDDNVNDQLLLSSSDSDNLGNILSGDRRRPSLYDLHYKSDVNYLSLCSFKLTEQELAAFSNAIHQHYIFEMFVDDLPVKGFVGEIEQDETTSVVDIEATQPHKKHTPRSSRIYLFQHLDFSIAYNGDHVRQWIYSTTIHI